MIKTVLLMVLTVAIIGIVECIKYGDSWMFLVLKIAIVSLIGLVLWYKRKKNPPN
jgi:hypothetical protein